MASPAVHLRRRLLSSGATSGGKSLPLAGPAVRFLLQHYGLTGAEVVPSGPKKNVVKSDLLTWIEKNKLVPVVVQVSAPTQTAAQPPKKSVAPQVSTGSARRTRSHVDISLAEQAQSNAKLLAYSKHAVPHAWVLASFDATNLLNFPTKSPAHFVARALEQTLRLAPELNVAADANGEPQRLGLAQVSLDDDRPSAFRVITSGAAVAEFAPSVKAGETAVISVGAPQISVSEFSAEIRPFSSISLVMGYDRRALDDEQADRLLARLRLLASQPELLDATAVLGGNPTKSAQNVDVDWTRLL